jgi:hypothetical protein
VTQARQALLRRLDRRGVSLPAALCAVTLAREAAVPAALTAATVRAALTDAAPPAVAALARGVALAAALTRAKLAGILVAAGLFAGGVASHGIGSTAAPQADPPPAAQRPAPAVEAGQNTRFVSGRVLDPDGNPAANARLHLVRGRDVAPAPQPTADAAGRFRFALPPDTTGHGGWHLLAAADGHGTDWTYLSPHGPGGELTLRLPADVPITGRVLDLEGRPAAGATVRLAGLYATPSGNLDEVLRAWAATKDQPQRPFFLLNRLERSRLVLPPSPTPWPAVTTDRDGRFTIPGVGRDRMAVLHLRGSGLTDQVVRVFTRPGFAPAAADGRYPVHGPDFTVTAAPGRPVSGVVREQGTGRPLAGVRVVDYLEDGLHLYPLEATTDAAGQYRLDGLPKRAQHTLAFAPGEGGPHLTRFVEVPDAEGLAPVTLDVELVRGVVVTGRVTDRATGRPVHALVSYEPLKTNEFFERTPGYDLPESYRGFRPDGGTTTDADGRYRLTALPGAGVLLVLAYDGTGSVPYLRAEVAPADRDPRFYNGHLGIFRAAGRITGLRPVTNTNGYRLIHPDAGAGEVVVDFVLDPGRQRRGRVVDADGRPVSGAIAYGLTETIEPQTLASAEFTAAALAPDKPRQLVFWDRGRTLAGTVTLKGDEPEPVTVTLRPLAAVTGRAVGPDGQPLAGARVSYHYAPKVLGGMNYIVENVDPQIHTDADGRFRIPGLPAGVEFGAYLRPADFRRPLTLASVDRLVLEPGQTKDLGELRARRIEP